MSVMLCASRDSEPSPSPADPSPARPFKNVARHLFVFNSLLP